MSTDSVLASHTPALPAPFSDTASARWERIVERHPQQAQQLLEHQDVGPTCALVLGVSEWIAQALIARPELIDTLLADFQSPRDKQQLAALVDTYLVHPLDQANVTRALRQFRHFEMLRITWRDLAGWADLNEVITTLSWLADVCIDVACTAAHQLMPERTGHPSLVDGQPPSLIVLGLGKLGGCELNLSSDIDLIFCYSGDGETDGERTLSHQEYFTRVGQLLIQLLSTVTEDGFVFRVDMRLRPNGDSGPLVLNFDAMEHYYQTHGRDWERYALVKARALTGAQNDRDDILSRLRPFIYRRYLDYRAFDAIRDMRRMIVEEIRGDVERDVKRGIGGIRQIEFIVQTLQLVRGGRLPELRTPHWSQARDALVAEQLLQGDVADTLTHAYSFLRRVEHRLQAVRDEQTHKLPDDEEAKQRLAIAMQFTDIDAFETALNAHRQAVSDCFNRHFSQHDDAESSTHKPEQTTTAIDSFADPETIRRLLQQAREGRHYTALTSDARQYLERLLPLVLNEAIATPKPETTVRRLLDVIQAIGRRTAYFALLVEEPVILHRLARLVSTSAWFSRWLGQYPVLLDTLLNATPHNVLLDAVALRADLQRDLKRAGTDDLESAMATLREFHHASLLRIGAADIDAQLDSDQVGNALTALAKVLIEGCVEVAAKDVNVDPATLSIIGYGRVGSGEMNYSSDLDLVFMFDDTDDTAPGTDQQGAIERSRSRLIRRIIHIMTTRTEAGDVYELDMRLRPNGRSGTLITTFDAYRTYQMTEAWDWEHQALVRARAIFGAKESQARFADIRRDILTRPREADSLRTSIVKMRTLMLTEHAKKQGQDRDAIDLKYSAGGLVDIEFIVQYLVLCHAKDHPILLTHGTTPALLGHLHEGQLINATQVQSLTTAYQSLMQRSRRQALMESDEISADPALLELMDDTNAHWNTLMQDQRAATTLS